MTIDGVATILMQFLLIMLILKTTKLYSSDISIFEALEALKLKLHNEYT